MTKNGILNTGKLARTAGMISGMILVSRLLGFVRETITGRLFNSNKRMLFCHVYYTRFMYYILVGALYPPPLFLFSLNTWPGKKEEGWRRYSLISLSCAWRLTVLA